MWRVEDIYEINKRGGWIFFLWRVEFFKISETVLHLLPINMHQSLFRNVARGKIIELFFLLFQLIWNVGQKRLRIQLSSRKQPKQPLIQKTKLALTKYVV